MQRTIFTVAPNTDVRIPAAPKVLDGHGEGNHMLKEPSETPAAEKKGRATSEPIQHCNSAPGYGSELKGIHEESKRSLSYDAAASSWWLAA